MYFNMDVINGISQSLEHQENWKEYSPNIQEYENCASSTFVIKTTPNKLHFLPLIESFKTI